MTWYGQDSSYYYGDYSVFVQAFNADGTANGDTVQLEAPGVTHGYDYAPQITAMGSTGAYAVTWQGDNGSGHSIFVQAFNADGTLDGGTVQLEAPGSINGYGAQPQITSAGTEGGLAVTWYGPDSDGDSSIFVWSGSFDTGTSVVRSSEPGTVCLVHESVDVNSLSDITSAAGNLWNSVEILAANASALISKSGLLDGNYNLYAVDLAGNLSSPSARTLIVDSLPPMGSVDLIDTSDSGFFVNDNVTNITAPTFRVTLSEAEVGDSVELLLDGDSFAHPLLRTLDATDISNGYVDFTVVDGDLRADGPRNIRASLEDPVGNQTFSEVLEITLDTGAPTVQLVRETVPSIVKLEGFGSANSVDGSPQVAGLGTSGAYAVTWRGEDSEGNAAVFVQAFNADGTANGVTVQLDVPGVAGGDDATPQVTAVGSDGAYVVTWSGLDDEGDYSIFVQGFNADGTINGTPVQLEATGATNAADFAPQVTAVGVDGAYAVTWTGFDGSDNSIFVQRFAADGSLNGEAVQLEATEVANLSDVQPQIAALGNGGFAVSWSGQDSDGDYSIFVQAFEADGSLNGDVAQAEPPGVADATDSHPQLSAVGVDGGFGLTWYGRDADGDDSIFVQLFNADGTLSGALVQLEATGETDGPDAGPQITGVGTEGAFVVTWHRHDSDGDYSIFLQAFNSDGTVNGDPAQLEATGVTDGADLRPQVTALGVTGEYAVTWSGVDADGDETVFVQAFNADGTPRGGTLQLEAPGVPAGADTSPQIAAVGPGSDFVVTWQGLDRDQEQSVYVWNSVSVGDPVVVRSTEPGAVYLVSESVEVNSLADITGAADNLWNSVGVTSPDAEVFIPTDGLTDGAYRLYAVDLAGNLSAPAALSVTVDSTAPDAPTIQLLDEQSGLPRTESLTDDNTPTFAGTAEAGSSVEVFDGVVSLGTVTADANGNWNFASAPVSDGLHSFTVIATDEFGNASVPSAVLEFTIDTSGDPESPPSGVLDLLAASDTRSDSDDITGDATPTLRVSLSNAAVGDSVELLLGGASFATPRTKILDPTDISNGYVDFSVVDGELGVDGLKSLTALLSDPAGNSSTTAPLAITLDTTAPVAPVITAISQDTGESSADGITSDPTLVFSGTSEPGATVAVSRVGTGVIGTVNADQFGIWTFDYTGTPLGGGQHSFTVTATDVAGNVSASSAPFVVIVNLTTPSGSVDLLAGSDTGLANTDDITSDASPTFRVSLTNAEVGDSVELLLVGASFSTPLTKILDGTDISNGYVDFTVAAGELGVDGSKSLTAQLSDPAGNSSTTAALEIALDTAAPAAPADLDLTEASDTGTSNSDDVTGDNTPTITGTAEAGSTVALYDTNGTTLLGTAVAGAGGTWSITSGVLSDGAHTLTARATDLAGNQSAASVALAITIDTSGGGDTAAPILQSFSSTSADGSYGPGASISITATFDEALRGDSTLTVVLDNGQSVVLAAVSGSTLTGTYTVGATGSAQDSADLTVGSISSASVFDLAGNQQTGTTVPAAPNNLGDTRDIVIDTTAPAALGIALDNDTGAAGDDAITSDGSYTVGGAETGALVEYSTNGTDWSATAPTPVEGTNSISVRQTDAAGNVSPVSTLSFTLDTTAPAALGIALDNDTGVAGDDAITSDGSYTVGGAETGALVEYSTNGHGLERDGADARRRGEQHQRAADGCGGQCLAGQHAELHARHHRTDGARRLDLTEASDTGTSNSDDVTGDNTPTITGTAEAGSTVGLYDTNGTTLLGTAVAGRGAPGVSPPACCPMGTHADRPGDGSRRQSVGGVGGAGDYDRHLRGRGHRGADPAVVQLLERRRQLWSRGLDQHHRDVR